jgi:hypothetical protein
VRGEGEVKVVLKVVVPAHRPLLLVIGIDHDLHDDPVLAGFVLLGRHAISFLRGSVIVTV